MVSVNLRKLLFRNEHQSFDRQQVAEKRVSNLSQISLEKELAGLSPEARARRIDKRRRYEQFAQRQALTEIESEATELRHLH